MFKRVNFISLRVVLSVLFLFANTSIFAQEQVESSDKRWYICEIKSSKKANDKKYFGPYGSKEETLANWMYLNLAENKKYCVAMNLTYMTATPSSYFGREWKSIKEDYDFDRDSFLEKYSIQTDEKIEAAYLKSKGIKPEKSKAEKKAKNEVKQEQKTVTTQAVEETPVETTKSAKENARLEQEKAKANAAAAKEQAKEVTKQNKELKASNVINDNKDAIQRANELTKSNKTQAKQADALAKENKNSSDSLSEAIDEYYKSEKRNAIKTQILKEAEVAPVKEAVIQEEPVKATPKETEIPADYENAEVKKDAQIIVDDNAADQKNEITETPVEESIPEPVVEPVEEIETTPEPEPEPAVEPEPVVEQVEETPAPFTFTSTQSANVNRYKKEYLQDFIPQEIYDTQYESTLKQKIDSPDEKDSKGQTLLMKAAKSGNDWQINTLLESGADVNLKDNEGWTALMYAARYQESISTLKTLIEAGANVKEKNNYGSSAMILAAAYNDNPEILSYLLKNYSNSEKEVLKCFILLLSSKQPSEYLQIAKVNLFMEKSIPLNTFYQGKTPLMYAAQYGNSTKTLKLLIDNDALTTIRSSEGKTAFDYATKNSNLLHDENYWALNKK